MTDNVTHLATRRRHKKRRCPICGKPTLGSFRPFCSAHCRRVDLDRWLGEAYRVPVEESSEPGSKEPDEE